MWLAIVTQPRLVDPRYPVLTRVNQSYTVVRPQPALPCTFRPSAQRIDRSGNATKLSLKCNERGVRLDLAALHLGDSYVGVEPGARQALPWLGDSASHRHAIRMRTVLCSCWKALSVPHHRPRLIHHPGFGAPPTPPAPDPDIQSSAGPSAHLSDVTPDCADRGFPAGTVARDRGVPRFRVSLSSRIVLRILIRV